MPSHVQIIVLFVVIDYLLILGKWLAQLMGLCGVVVSMFDFHRSDRGSNPGRGGEFS